MKKTKRFLSVILSVMMISMMTGCSGKGGEKAASLPESSSNAGNPPSNSANPGSESNANIAYPIEGGGTLSIWMSFPPNAAKYFQSLAENETMIQIQKETGINIQFVHPPQGQESENFNLLVASGKLPDIIKGQKYKGGAVAAVNDGVFADLTDLIPEYAPDYYKRLEEDDMFRKLATTNEGKIYSMYSYKRVSEPFWYRPQFRTDWLRKFNMEIPLTLDEYEAYFEKVLETKPGVAPFCLNASGLEGQILGAFDIGQGVRGNGDGFFVKDGRIKHTYTEAAFKDYLTLMRDWYEKGYILKDFTTANYETTFASGKVALSFANSVKIYPASKELGFEASSGPYPRLKKGQQYHTAYYYWPLNGDETNINAKSKNIELALKFLNYGFTDKGILTFNYGPEGTAWKMVDEKPVYQDYILSSDKYNITDAEYTIRSHDGWARERLSDGVAMAGNSKDPECWNYRMKWNDDKTVDSDYAIPPLSYPSEDNSKRAKIMTDVNTYASEMILKYITSAASLDNFENEFVKNVKELGIDEAIHITQKAYDALMRK